LPPRHRPAARLAGLGRSLPQIASELGISMRAAEVRLSRARAALRQRLCVEGGALNYTSSGTSALGEVG
jgi:DNA-directed RNA polymerase specialized sigma24 family protein